MTHQHNRYQAIEPSSPPGNGGAIERALEREGGRVLAGCSAVLMCPPCGGALTEREREGDTEREVMYQTVLFSFG